MKPKVTTNCVADRHSGPDERIVEFSAGPGATGGLIAFRWCEATGRLIVDVYKCDPAVVVRAPSANLDTEEK